MIPRDRLVVAAGMAALAAGLLLYWWWSAPWDAADPATSPSSQQTAELGDGQALATKHCSVCHVVPAPDILHKLSWEPMLAYMGYRMGITDISYLPSHPPHVVPSVKSIHGILQRESAVPERPALKPDEWAALRR